MQRAIEMLRGVTGTIDHGIASKAFNRAHVGIAMANQSTNGERNRGAGSLAKFHRVVATVAQRNVMPAADRLLDDMAAKDKAAVVEDSEHEGPGISIEVQTPRLCVSRNVITGRWRVAA